MKRFYIGVKVRHKDPITDAIFGTGTIIRRGDRHDWIVDFAKRGEVPMNEDELRREDNDI